MITGLNKSGLMVAREREALFGRLYRRFESYPIHFPFKAGAPFVTASGLLIREPVRMKGSPG